MYIVFCLLFFCIYPINCYYPEFYIEDDCKLGNGSVIYDLEQLGEFGTLKATSDPPYSINQNCTVTLKVPSDKGIVLSVRKIDFAYRSHFCADYLKIIRHDSYDTPTLLCKFKFDLKENLSFYSRGHMTIYYHTSSPSILNRLKEMGFMLTYTVVSEDVQDCLSDDMFMCGNGRCMSKKLTCDGRNNCGDNTDESSLTCDPMPSYYFRATDFMYTLLLFFFLLFLFSWIMYTNGNGIRRALFPETHCPEKTGKTENDFKSFPPPPPPYTP